MISLPVGGVTDLDLRTSACATNVVRVRPPPAAGVVVSCEPLDRAATPEKPRATVILPVDIV
jgi:hypothetical protein